MKKLLKQIIFSVFIFFAAFSVAVSTGYAEEISVVINGEECDFDHAPVVKDSMVMVPMRSTLEAVSAEVFWDEETRTAIGVWNDLVVKAPLGSNAEDEDVDVDEDIIDDFDSDTVLLSGAKKVESDVYVSLRNVFEAMGGFVSWNSEERKIDVLFQEEIPDEKLMQLIDAVAEVPEDYFNDNDDDFNDNDNDNDNDDDNDYNTEFYQKGTASWYGARFHGNNTASGEPYNMYNLTAAHLELPFGTKVKVTNLVNAESVIVRINDRGPHIQGRIIDLSKAAAEEIGLRGLGTVKLEIID